MSKVKTKWIEDSAVTADKIATSAVGDGLTGGGGTALAVQADATGGANLAKAINVSANGVAVKVDASTINENGSDQLYVPNGGITETQLNTSVAGNGLTGGGGSALAVDPDTTGGANLATVINVSSNGVAVKIDSSTIGENGSNQLYVPNGGITETQLNTSVAGAGISGGGGTALALDINELTSEAAADDADTIAIYDSTATAVRKQTRANFLSGVKPVLSKSITVESPTATEDISIFFTNLAITVTEIRAVVRGTTPSVTWTIRHGTSRSGTGAEVVTGGTATTDQSTGSDVTSFDDATIVADSFVWLETTAQTGTVEELAITIVYTED